jgi:hypothetical protein
MASKFIRLISCRAHPRKLILPLLHHPYAAIHAALPFFDYAVQVG